ncbi:MAG: molecular chaperone HtpG [Gammaproteobacteria bacterium]|nr:molecular chaperone HtpG [Gammaproteobacteria bacterium]
MTEQATAETRGFQTEARKLLKLMINSLYSNREIFLRELISNASDAIDRLRFESLKDDSLTADDPEFKIAIEFDPDAGTVSVVDNGIGMGRDEAVENLGTIAKSGTEEFFDALTGDEQKDSALIGQFGVGFYSSFIVAGEVEVLTRRAGEDIGTRWTSTGEDEFTVEDAADLPRGTRVTLTLKPDAKEFAESFRLRSVVRKYSDHVGVPVLMAKESGGQDEDDDDDDDTELEAVNSAKALWTRPRNDIDDDEYKEFYKHVSHDFDDPAAWSHNKVEGKLDYTSLLYIPKRAPFDLWNREMPRGLKLYVQRVFIMDEADEFLPLYLRFVRGVVDSSDLPLNVSREILQQDDRTRTIRNALTKRVLDMLAKMDAEEYGEVWDEFGLVLKEGLGEDFANKDELLGLLRFASTHDSDPTQRTSLKAYISRMNGTSEQADPEQEAEADEESTDDESDRDTVDDESGGKRQDKIYYLIADSDAAARSSPHLEAFRARGIEVLLLSDRIDEWWMSFVEEFDGLKFQDVARGELDLDDEADESKEDEKKSDDEPLLKRIGEVLGDKVESVRESKRLTDSPACLVLGEHDMGIQMRRIMEATGQAAPDSKPHFEVNLAHPLVERLNDEADEDRFGDVVSILFDQASLAEGNAVAEPGAYVQRVNKLLVELLG